MLPIIDVRDAAHAHVMMITDKKFDSNGRHFLAERSMWFSEIIELLKDNNKAMNNKKRIRTRVLGKM
jgi:hypothetical protein